MLGATPQRYLEALEHLVGRLDVAELTAMAGAICTAYRQGRTVFCFGNGGNAATASHFAADLTKLTVVPRLRRRLRAVSLNDSASAMTAIGNDMEFDEIFSEQLRTYLAPGDVVLGLSTSGTSPNVVKALEYGEAAGAVTMSITSTSGQLARSLSAHCVMIDSTSVQHVEELTLVATHLLCMICRATLLAFTGDEEETMPLPLNRAANPAVSA